MRNKDMKRECLMHFSSTLPILIYIFSTAFGLICETFDRKYSCDCSLEHSNQSLITTDDYNSWRNFEPAMKSLQYCQGSFQCQPETKQNHIFQLTTSDNRLVCFSENSCLSNGSFESSSLHGFSGSCIMKDCMYLMDMVDFSISGSGYRSGMDIYKCIKVGSHSNYPFCIKPVCKSFLALEKFCTCNFLSQSCNCTSTCEQTPQNTYVLILSFPDVFSRKTKSTHMKWLILLALCVGLTLLLIIFCKLCKAAMDPSNRGSDAQNTETLRRVLTYTLDQNNRMPSAPLKELEDSPKLSVRSSPPPTYEQVLKDKCIEFKKSMA